MQHFVFTVKAPTGRKVRRYVVVAGNERIAENAIREEVGTDAEIKSATAISGSAGSVTEIQ